MFRRPNRSSIRFVFHIGAGKSGSSAIQRDLEMRATELRSAGVLIPDTNMGLDDTINGQQVFFFERLRQMDADAARSLWRAKCDRLLAVARSEGLHTIVVSAENLLNPTSVALLIDEIDAEVEIIAYVRRQLDYLVSAWQQWYLKAYRSVDVFLHLNLGTVANWNLCLAQWESTFGRERIQIRRFDRTTLKGGDVVTDFRHTAGLPAAPSALQVEQVNTSYSDGFTALAMRVTDKFDTFAQYRAFYAMLSSLAGELADREQITTFPFTPDQVARIDVSGGQRGIANEVLSRGDGDVVPAGERCRASVRPGADSFVK